MQSHHNMIGAQSKAVSQTQKSPLFFFLSRMCSWPYSNTIRNAAVMVLAALTLAACNSGGSSSGGGKSTPKDTTAPEFTKVSITSTSTSAKSASGGSGNRVANNADSITVSFTVNENLAESDIEVLIQGQEADVTPNGSAKDWKATYKVTQDTPTFNVQATAADQIDNAYFVITAKDSAGNESTQTEVTDESVVKITLQDTTPAEINDVTVDTNNANSKYAKEDDTITVTVTASEYIKKPTFALLGADIAEGRSAVIKPVEPVISYSKTWKLEYTVSPGDREGIVTGAIKGIRDAADNATDDYAFDSSIDIDTTEPGVAAITVTSDSTPDSAKASNVITIDFTADEAVSNVTVQVQGQEATVTKDLSADAHYTATYTVKALTPSGVATVAIGMTDLAGNKRNSSVAPYTPAVDISTDAPKVDNVAISGRAPDGTPKTRVKPGDIVTVSFDSSVDATQQAKVTIAGEDYTADLAEGSNSFDHTVDATDPEGPVAFTVVILNKSTGEPSTLPISSTTDGSRVIVDRTKPQVEVAIATTGKEKDGVKYAKERDIITLTLTANEKLDATPDVALSYGTVTPDPQPTVNPRGQNTWIVKYQVPATDTSADGNDLEYTITYSDIAGNDNATDATQDTVRIDTVTPTLSNISFTDNYTYDDENADYSTDLVVRGSEITLTFKTSETLKASDIQVTIDNKKATVSEDDTTTNSWKATYTVPASATFGSEIGFTIAYTDPAGNAGDATQDNTADNAVKARYVTEKDPGKPVLEAVTVYSNNSFKQDYATHGNTVTIDFTADRALQSAQVVFTLAGDKIADAETVQTKNNDSALWEASYTIPADSTANGLVTFTINYTSTSTIRGVPAASGDTVRATTDGSSVTIDTTPVDLTSTVNPDNLTITFWADPSADDAAGDNQIIFGDTGVYVGGEITDRTTDDEGRLVLVENDRIQIDFATEEALGATPEVTIVDLTSDLTQLQPTDDTTWRASYTVRKGGSKGPAIATIAVQDHIGNASDATADTNGYINVGATATVTDFTSDGNAGYAINGDTITLTFNLDETVDAGRLAVSIAGQTANASQTTGQLNAGADITYTYQVVATDVSNDQGAATVVITLDDEAGDRSDAIFDTNSVPVVKQASLEGTPTQIVIDTIAPEVSGLRIGAADTPVAGKVTNGGLITLAITASEVVTGTSTVTIAGLSGKVKNPRTNWEVQLELIDTVNLTDATYNASNIASLVAVSLTDLAGNTGTAINGVTGSVIVDRTAPGIADTPAPTYVINPDSGDDGIAQHGDVITFTFTTTEPIKMPKIPVVRFGSASASTIASGNADRTQWIATRTIRDSEDSRVTSLVISVDLSDDLNNTASDLTRDSGIEVQAGAPRLTELSMTSNNANSTWAKVGDVITVTIATTENILVTSVMVAGKEATIQNSGTPAPNWTATVTVDNTFTQGGASIAVTHTTPSGEESSTSYALIGDDTTAVSIDTIPPTLDTVSLTTPANGAKVRGDVVLALAFSEEPVGLTAVVFGFVARITDGASATEKRATIPATSLKHGKKYTLDDKTIDEITSFTDAAGNNGSVVAIPENASFIVDTKAPVVSNFTTSIQTGGATGTSDGDTAYHGAVVQVDFSTDETFDAASTSVRYGDQTLTSSSPDGTAWSGTLTIDDMRDADSSGSAASFTVTTADDIDNTADTTQTGTVSINTETPTGTAVLSVDKTSVQSDGNGRTTDGYARAGDTIKVAISGIHGQYEARNPQITIGTDRKTGNDLTIDTSQDGIYEISYVVQSGDNGVVTFRVDLARHSGATARTINTATPATDVTVDTFVTQIRLTGATSTNGNLVKVNDVTLSVDVPDDLAGGQAPIVLRVTKNGQESQTITVHKTVNANTTQLTLTVGDFQELTSSGNLTISFDDSAALTDLAGNKIGFTGSANFTYVSASDFVAVESHYQEDGRPASRIGAGDFRKTDLFAFRNLGEDGSWSYSITVTGTRKGGTAPLTKQQNGTQNVSNRSFSLNPFDESEWMEFRDNEEGNYPLSIEVRLTHARRQYDTITLTIPKEQYLLKSWQDVQGIDHNRAGDYTLMNDITFPEPGADGLPAEGFDPIGWFASRKDYADFSGSLNGKGKTLRNFFINRPDTDAVGLFARLQNATVDNLHLRLRTALSACKDYGFDVAICGRSYAGGIAGRMQDSTISNSSVHGHIGGGSRYVGGLVGDATGSTIGDSHSSGEVLVKNDTAGGLVGRVQVGSTIYNSYSTADVNGGSSVSGSNTGLLVGNAESLTNAPNTTLTIRNSFASGNLYTTKSDSGGLVGVITLPLTITNSYVSGNVTAECRGAGGLLGHLGSTTATLTITNVYVNGRVSDRTAGSTSSCGNNREKELGTFIGSINREPYDITNVNSYWDYNIMSDSGEPRVLTSTGAFRSGDKQGERPLSLTGGTSTKTMVSGGQVYINWDFTSVWDRDRSKQRNGGYPWLRGVGPQPDNAKQLLALHLQADTTADAKVVIDEGRKTGAVQLPANTDTANMRIGYIWIAGASASLAKGDTVILSTNSFTITVTDANGATQDYTITVTQQ